MDKISTLVSLDNARSSLEELAGKLRRDMDESASDSRKMLILALAVLGGLIVIGTVAFLVYRYFSDDYDDFDDFDDFDDPELYGSEDDFEE